MNTIPLPLHSLNRALDGWEGLAVPEIQIFNFVRLDATVQESMYDSEKKNKCNITYDNKCLPRSSLIEDSAPCSNNSSTISRSPRHTAYCKGVDPDSDARRKMRPDLTSFILVNPRATP